MRKLLSYLKPYKLHMGIALILMLAELAVELWQPLMMAKIIDEGIMKKDMGIVLQWGGLMLGVSTLAFFAGITNSFYAGHASQSFGYEVRKSLFVKVQSFSFANFNRFPTSSLITRMTNDVTLIQNTVFMSLRIMLRAPLLVFGGLIMALLINLKLGLIIAGAVPILIFFLVWAMKRAVKLFRSIQEKLDAVNIVMRENLTGMRLVKAFLRSNHEMKRFTTANEALMKRTVSSFRLVEFTTPVLLLVMNFGMMALLWFGSVEVNSGRIHVGELVALINYAARITSALSIFSMIVMVFSRAKASSQRIIEVLETEIDLHDEEDADSSAKIKAGKVEFKNVSFSFPGTNTTVLSDLSFIVEPGQTVAILGATGSGKTSLFQLIPRLYDVNEGSILIDDQDIRHFKLDTLRKQIGFVPQESLLFTGSIQENISWGKSDASFEEITEAARNAQVHETIEQLPRQYEAVIGQKGVNLSGGQKQRISIARALIRKPPLLLLDDSTSALDMKTEANFLKDLEGYNCTTFLITQKLNTAMEADMILLLDDGKLLAQGKHDELIVKVPLYREIYESQFGKEGLRYAQRVN